MTKKQLLEKVTQLYNDVINFDASGISVGDWETFRHAVEEMKTASDVI